MLRLIAMLLAPSSSLPDHVSIWTSRSRPTHALLQQRVKAVTSLAHSEAAKRCWTPQAQQSDMAMARTEMRGEV